MIASLCRLHAPSVNDDVASDLGDQEQITHNGSVEIELPNEVKNKSTS
jgi:hypothetical protein